MKHRELLLVAVLTSLAGCGVGLHMNSTTAVTAPFHDHQKAIARFRALPAQVALKPTARPAVAIGSFHRYYPLPMGFVLGTAKGPARSWGKAKLVTWFEYRPEIAPEAALRSTFAEALGGGDPSARVRLDGVVTEFSWYMLPDASGGRITVQLTLQDERGHVLYEGEQTTVGRADSPIALLRTHVNEWLASAELARALSAGGAR